MTGEIVGYRSNPEKPLPSYGTHTHAGEGTLYLGETCQWQTMGCRPFPAEWLAEQGYLIPLYACPLCGQGVEESVLGS